MSKQIIIAEQHSIAAVFAEDQIQELIVATGHHQVGDVYLGIIENVLPSIDAAFVNIGNPDRNGFIHVTDLGPLRLKRSAATISELVTPQQKVLVQVMKEPTGNKGPRLTGNPSFPGRYLVLMPYGKGVHLSTRIRDEDERTRLKALAILIKPAQMGLVVRTEADGIPEDSIIEDLDMLVKQWEQIQQESSSSRAPALLRRDDDFIQRVLRDAFDDGVNRIVTDTNDGMQQVRQQLKAWSQGQLPKGVVIDSHKEPTPILDFFRVTAAIRQALRPRVDLPSGGYIIIEPTEALTVVDVNSGSFTRSATSRETVLWTNCEAATEIARQLRLRNIAGVIIVDFIDMDSRRDKLQVLEHFQKALRSDKARPQIAQLSELGLVELTRKRQGQSLYEIFGRPCPTCDGLGIVMHLPGELPPDPEMPDPVRDLLTATPKTDRFSKRRNGERRTERSERPEVDKKAKPVRAPEPTPIPAAVPVVAAAVVVEERPEPQVVTVAMTELQQQVFSEMGISPLVLVSDVAKGGRQPAVMVVDADALTGEGLSQASLQRSEQPEADSVFGVVPTTTGTRLTPTEAKTPAVVTKRQIIDLTHVKDLQTKDSPAKDHPDAVAQGDGIANGSSANVVTQAAPVADGAVSDTPGTPAQESQGLPTEAIATDTIPTDATSSDVSGRNVPIDTEASSKSGSPKTEDIAVKSPAASRRKRSSSKG